MNPLPILYIRAEGQARALQATLEAIADTERAARGTSPTIGYSLAGMWAFDAEQAARYYRYQLNRGAFLELGIRAEP